MKFFSWLSRGTKTVDDVFDKEKGLLSQAGGWIGNMHFTEEEKSEARERLNLSVTDFVKSTLEESTERSITRRAIAVLWVKVQLAMILIVAMVAPFDLVLAKFYAEITFGALMLSGTLSVIAFFFGSHMIRSSGLTRSKQG